MKRLFSSLVTFAAVAIQAGEPAGTAVDALPVIEEPLHVVRHRGEHFQIYTNWIEPGVWTLYHAHHNDLLAVIAADVTAASQAPGSEPREQAAPAGTVLFFPYADSRVPYVHRVGVRGDGPFVNIGLEFRDPPTAACAKRSPRWGEGRAEALVPNRRGQAYRLRLSPDDEIELPGAGRGLLLVPLGDATLNLGHEMWKATAGDFRFYEGAWPGRLRNHGDTAATLVLFDAC